MKVKLPYLPYLGIGVVVCFVLLSGCATTGSTSKDVAVIPPVSDEAPEKVRITEFILGPGDRIEIIVYRHDDLKRTVQIDTSGKITYPLVGDVQAAGVSIFQLRDRIRDGLSKYIINPQVSVAVTSVQSQKVIVLGEVKNPGLFALEGPMNALEAISRAGGFGLDAKQNSVLLIRGGMEKPELVKLNLKDVLYGNDLTQNISLQNRDILYVPTTVIADVARFFDYIYSIIHPIVDAERGYYLGQQIESGRVAIGPP